MAMTAQHIFTTVATHLLAQNLQAKDPNKPTCFYRGPNGTKCAAGILIPDEIYDPGMELHSYSRLVEDFPPIEKLIGIENEELVTDLQDLHDNSLPETWPVKLQVLAIEWGVSMP
jgi:hypothetical protein